MTWTIRVYREGHLQDEAVDLESISDVLEQPDSLLWLDLEGPTEEDVSVLGREFGFHELALEDCLHPHQRPKIEQYGSYYFLVAYAVSTNEGFVKHEMAAFVGRNYLVTVRKPPFHDLTDVVKRLGAHHDLCREGGAYLLYILLDEVVDGYFTALELLEDAAEEVEDGVFRGDQPATTAETAGQQTDLFRLKKELMAFRRVASPLREVLDVMQRRTIDVVTPRLEPYYRDVYDHVLRATDFLDNLRDILSSTMEANLAVISNRLNEVMKRLTSWGAIILVPTLIAGIYGMNFRHMPELSWRLGYPMSLGLMVLSGVLLYRAFKRRGWL